MFFSERTRRFSRALKLTRIVCSVCIVVGESAQIWRRLERQPGLDHRRQDEEYRRSTSRREGEGDGVSSDMEGDGEIGGGEGDKVRNDKEVTEGDVLGKATERVVMGRVAEEVMVGKVTE